MANKNIILAIEYLPEHYITKEMVWDALKTGDIDLLDHLPSKYMKPHLINMLLRYDKSKSSSFDLDKIPEICRTKNICERAVLASIENYKYVPDPLKSTDMLHKVSALMNRYLDYLPIIPASTWDKKSLYNAIEALIKENGYSYFNDWSHSGLQDVRTSHSKTNSLMLIQILLTYVPNEVKTKAFYHGLFEHSRLTVPDIDLITPLRCKNKKYYNLMAAKNFKYVPVKKIDYKGLYTAIESGSLGSNTIFNNTSDYHKRIFEVMDDKMADLIARKHPDKFSYLPDKFLTSKRFAKTIHANPNHYDFYKLVTNLSKITDKNEKKRVLKIQSIINKGISRMLVKGNKALPEFPRAVWDERLVDYCMKHGTKFRWFEIMPVEFQTQEIVNAAVEYDPNNLRYVHHSYKNSYMAMKLFRIKESINRYIPVEYFTQFREDTGLSDRFFGGEVTYIQMRENKDIRKQNIYFQSGNSFFGFYCENNAYRLIMTKPKANGEAPKKVFDVVIKSFHQNWLEKAICDNEPGYVKPTVLKSLRHLQYLNYYDVEKDIFKDGVQVYKNTFRDETIGYVALRDDELIFEEERDELFQYFEEEEETIESETTIQTLSA